MRTHSRFIVGIFLLTQSLATHAAEESEKKAEAGTEKKEEGGGEKKAEKKIVDDKPWIVVQSKIAEAKSKRHSLEEELDGIFKQKKTAPPGSPEMRALVKEAEDKYKDLVKQKEEEEKQTRILQFRYPERAKLEKPTSEETEKKPLPSLEKMEEQKTIESQLQENYKLMKQQYPK